MKNSGLLLATACIAAALTTLKPRDSTHSPLPETASFSLKDASVMTTMDGEKLSVDSLQSNTTGLPEDYEKRTAAADLESSTPDPVEEVGEPPALTAPALFDGATLEPTATNKSAVPSVNNVKSIPNGGLKAWLQVLGAFFLFFNSWGIINTFGVYQTYYESGILSSSTPSDISWIGSVQAFLLMFVGRSSFILIP